MQFQSHPVFGFTRKYPGRSNVLTSDISVSLPFDPNAGEPEPEKKMFNCIWDTGASGTVITPNVVTSLNLKPTGKAKSFTVGQGGVNEYLANTYLVNRHLPPKWCKYGRSESYGGSNFWWRCLVGDGHYRHGGFCGNQPQWTDLYELSLSFHANNRLRRRDQ